MQLPSSPLLKPPKAPSTEATGDPLESAFSQWRTDPSREATGLLLKHLQPTIDRGVSMYVGQNASPILRSRAKQLALAAAKSYDPSQSKLTTHVTNHLQGLRRVARQQEQILRIPERASLDRAALYHAEQELQDQLGRPASTQELADHTSLSPRRIAKIRTFGTPLAEGSFVSPETGEVASLPFSSGVREEHLIHAVYGDLAPRDQQILEWTLGMYGKPQLDNRTIATKLQLSPGAVSQRKAIIQKQIDELRELRPY